jgi:MoaA/NifB/PqqE/SkfB family radical SAM enzyme
MLDPSVTASYDAGRRLAGRPFRSVCYSPFNSMYFDTLGMVRACCINAGYPLGDLKQQRLDEIWFGPKTKRLREAMLQYDLRLGCGQCEWQIKNGNFTNEVHTLSSVHAFKFDDFPVVPADGGGFWPTNLEFNLSNVCNLECVTCNGDVSSLIRAKRDKLPPLPHVYGDTFFADLEKYLVHVSSAQFLGGEPFLIQEHFRAWDLLVAAGRVQWVGIVTNGTVWNERVERVLERLPVHVAMSIDGATRETFEKIRVNAKYDTFMANCRKFNDYHRAHGRRLSFNFTLSTLNVHEFADFLLLADGLDGIVTVCTLSHPEEYCLYKLDAARLRDVVVGLERRDDEMRRTLKLNRAVWDGGLGNLRNELASRRPAAASVVAAAPTPSGPRMSDGFARLRGATAEGEEAQHAREVAQLTDWSGGGVDELLTDAADLVTQVCATGGGVLDPALPAVGRTLDDVRDGLVERFGRDWKVAELEVNDHRIDRILTIGDVGRAAADVRTIVVARYGTVGEFVGLRVLMARRRPVAVRA